MRYSVFIYLETNLEHHGEFEPGKVQYSNPNFIDLLFLIGNFNPKSRQGTNLACLGGPEHQKITKPKKFTKTTSNNITGNTYF